MRRSSQRTLAVVVAFSAVFLALQGSLLVRLPVFPAPPPSEPVRVAVAVANQGSTPLARSWPPACLLEDQHRKQSAAWIDFNRTRENRPILNSVHSTTRVHTATFLAKHLNELTPGLAGAFFENANWTCVYHESQSHRNHHDSGTTTPAAATLPGTIDVWKHPKQAPFSSLTIECPVRVNETAHHLSLTTVTVDTLPESPPAQPSRHVAYDVRSLLRCEEEEEEAPHKRLVPTGNETTSLPTIGACVLIGGCSWGWGAPPDGGWGCVPNRYGSAWNKRLPEFLAYHRLLGVDRFWLYFRLPWESIEASLPRNQTDLSYVPYDTHFVDERTGEPRETLRSLAYWQAAMNQDCRLRAQKQGLDWLITTDPDEMIFVVDNDDEEDSNTTTNTTHNHPIRRKPPHPLKRFLAHGLTEEDRSVGNSLRLHSIPYGRNHEQLDDKRDDDDNPKDPVLQMDYRYRYEPVRPEQNLRPKFLINLATATDADVHHIRGPWRRLDWETEARLHHYKAPDRGVFYDPRHKRPDDMAVVRESSLPDRFRAPVLESIHATMGRTPFGNTQLFASNNGGGSDPA